MNEETMNEVEVTEVDLTEDETNPVESGESSGGKGVIVGAALIGVAGYLVGRGIEYAGKKAVNGIRNWRAQKKVVPDEEGNESEAEEVTEEAKKQEENVQKNRKK